MPDLKENKKSSVQEFTKMIRELAHIKPTKNMTSSYSNLKKVKHLLYFSMKLQVLKFH